ncbi:YceD family protein [Alteraurantiacibacter aquimixticola]|uniref:DUF177 domain-containing protein n=1 Tax=Alteraurantiacibacter aquimixticola TaxID=2489173 RepID=A0A4T3EYD2_9SPHN|nr:YceD family protein [Alteraurantiacibacter aquimixticola]TIX49659.1 DUF177 domain-containing protein [Alteraurantiacibacter aquimixticola]
MSAENGSPEFRRMMDRREISDGPVALEANEAERAALAERFGLIAIHALTAELTLEPEGDRIAAKGTLAADIVQSCAISGDDLPQRIRENIAFTFVPDIAPAASEEEIELEEGELDEIPYSGIAFDLGEAVAQSLALAIDPYATGPDADTVREEHDLAEKAPSGPLQDALAKLKKG